MLMAMILIVDSPISKIDLTFAPQRRLRMSLRRVDESSGPANHLHANSESSSADVSMCEKIMDGSNLANKTKTTKTDVEHEQWIYRQTNSVLDDP